MSILGAIRPGEWDIPLFLHVLGALVMIGAAALAATFLFAAARDGSTSNLRLALRTLTLGVIPAWIVFRVAAEWIADKEGFADLDEPPSWINIGYITSELGFLLIIVSSLLGWFTLRRTRTEGTETEATPSKAVRAASILIAVVIVLNVVALWAMTTKPG
ncbi:MAG: hypothetical protein U0R51_03940 [Solirubrobacterales bacterium]